MLQILLERHESVVSREEVLARVWSEVAVSESAFDSVVRDLRRALDDSASEQHYIATVRGRGLRLACPATRLEEAEGSPGLEPGDPWRSAAARLEQALQALDLLASARGEAAKAARAELLVALARARWAAGATRDARKVFRSAVELGRATGDAEILARAALGFAGRTDANLGVRDEACRLLEEALTALPDGAEVLRGELAARLGTELAWTAEHGRALTLVDQALDLAERSGDAGQVAYALNAAHFLRQGPDGDPLDRLARMDRAVAVMAEQPASDVLVSSLQQRCIDLLELGRGAEWEEARIQFRDAAEALGQPFFLWLSQQYEGLAALLDGDLEQAEAQAEAALALGRRIGTPNALGTYAGQLYSIRRAQGRLADLAPLLEAAAEQLPHLAIVRAALPCVWLAAGDETRARSTLATFLVDELASLPRDPLWIATLATLAPAAAEIGEPAWIAACRDALLPFAGRLVVVGFGTATHGAVDQLLGQLAAGAGEHEQARAHYEAAVALYAHARAPLWEAAAQRAQNVSA